MSRIDDGPSSDESRAPCSWLAAVAAELREHPMAYAVLALFVVAGPVVTYVLFPDAPRGVGLFGGIALGAYAALCAMPGRFL